MKDGLEGLLNMEKLNDKKTTILATCFDDVKINPYQVKTKGKHPIFEKGRWDDNKKPYILHGK